MSPTYDPRHLRHAFGRAAESYEAAAVLQREVQSRLLEQLDYLDDRMPGVALDVGAGPGGAAAAMKKRWPRSRVVALDMALPMLRQAKRKASWWRPFSRVCADAARLPFIDDSVDVIFSSLCLQWAQDLPATLAEFRRVLRPDGLLLFSTFGPGTLAELRGAFAAADEVPHVSAFAPIQAVGDALVQAGFRDPVVDTDSFTLTYPDLMTLMRELRAIGATNALDSRRRSLTGKRRIRDAEAAYEAHRRDGVLPSTWEVIYAQAWGPKPGAPRREAGVDVAHVPVAGIPIRRRPRS